MRIDLKISIRTLAKRLGERSFSESSSYGFVLDRVRDEYLEARFIERFAYQELVVDPFGNERTIDRIEFKQYEFRITVIRPGLELINIPRSSQNLVNQLLEVTDFIFAIDPLSVDVLDWTAGIQEKLNKQMIIDSMQLGSLHLDTGVTARVIVKGNRDVRDALEKLIQNRRYEIEKIHCVLTSDGKRASMVLVKNASAYIDGDGLLLGDLLESMRSSIPMATNSIIDGAKDYAPHR